MIIFYILSKNIYNLSIHYPPQDEKKIGGTVTRQTA